MKRTHKRINVELSDDAIEYITREAKRDNISFQEEMQIIFYIHLDRLVREYKEGYTIIPIR